MAALLISLLSLGVSGEPRVAWSGADVCPGAEFEFERALDDYVGEQALHEGVAADVALSDGGGSGMRLTLTLESEAGREQHELGGLGCEQLIDHAALLVAGVIDPFVYAGGDLRMQHEVVPIQRPRQAPITKAPPTSEHPLEPAPEPEPEPQPESEFGPLLPTPDRVSRDRPRNRAAIGAAAIGFVGLFPQIGGGAQAQGAFDRGAFRWQGTITGYFGGRLRASDVDIGANLWALAGSTGFCGVPRARRIHIPLCGVAGLGFISARAIGTLEPHRSIRPWVHVGGEVGVSLVTRPNISLGLGLGVHAGVVRPSWEVRSPDLNYGVPPVMGLLRAIVEFHGRRDQNARP